MAIAADLMNVGMAGPMAGLIDFTPTTLTTTGTSSGTAVTIQPGNGHFIKLDTASSQTGAIFSANMELGVPYILFNPDSDSAVIYPMSGATINAASSLTIAQNKVAIMTRWSTTIITSVLTA